ncbi:MAG: alternative ribosome rescue aminoacyl-tRNA hydrolase ArfB [Gemmataceae bacterium]
MFAVNERIQIPDDELQFTYARSGGPGGQNVNKVSSKAVLRWNLGANGSVPAEIKARLRGTQRRRITVDDEIVIQSQEYRDQERNRLACLEKLREFLIDASFVPKPRRSSKPTRGSKQRRLTAKKMRSAVKSGRQAVKDE